MPVLNEAKLIGPFLLHLRERAPSAELIVADGGSTDATRSTAEPLCDQLVESDSGRAHQLNAGASAAGGDVLWFLHADSEVPLGCLDDIRRAVADRRVAGGYFRINLPKTHAIYRLTDSFAHYAGIALRIRCGDHGFFCRRGVFVEAGGFPDVPLMEDVEFYRKLHRFGRVRAVHRRLKTSVRRYEQFGRVRVTFFYGLIATLYALGFPLRILARIYAATCQPSTRSRITR
ncbi:MAG TPA: TIGR04283 family arsenosugar biosynthesis glycosyltransferase [Chthoniobacterales bacterium]|nr:TIGR04283 family arsenosugar biosynthesis glycosyltransferase [Chthoniobacterales bacterium]